MNESSPVLILQTVFSHGGLDSHAILFLQVYPDPLVVRAMKQTFLLTLLLNVFLASCIDRSVAEPPQEPVYLVTAKDASDEITIQNGGDLTIMDVQSFSGIGSAKIELDSGDMLEAITIHLHLAGLEEFRISSEKTVIAASFSSRGALNNGSQKIIVSGEELSITSDHPMWLNIRVVSSESTPNIPLHEEEYFEIALPGEFIDESGSSFEIHWVDFYR